MVEKTIFKETLVKLSEEIETFSMSDTDAWRKAEETLHELIESLPDDCSPIRKLLRFAEKGLTGIVQKKITDIFAMVDGMINAFEAASEFLSDTPNSREKIREAGQAIDNLLPNEFRKEIAEENGHEQIEEKEQPVFTLVDDTSPGTDDRETNSSDVSLTSTETDEKVSESEDSDHDYMPEDPDMELIGEFVGEAMDLIASAEESMLALEADPDDEEAVSTIFRAFHTVKGNAAFLDLTLLNKMGHSAESLLSRVRDGEIRYSGGYADLALQALDMIKMLIQSVEYAMSGNPLTKPEGYDQLLKVLADPESNGISDTGDAQIGENSAEEPTETEESDPDHDYMPEDPDMELIGEFVGEAMDLIANAEESMLALEADPDDEEAVSTIFRAFHTVKGNAAFLDLTLLNKMGHSAESLLSRVRDGEIRYSGGYADLSLKALDMIKTLIKGVENAISGSPLTKPEGYDHLLAVLADPEAAGINSESDDSDGSDIPRLGDLLVAQGKADREKLETAVKKNPEKPVGVAVVKTKAASLQDVSHALRTQQRMKSGKRIVEQTVRIGTRRLDRLIDMVGEIVIAHSMVAQDKVVVDSNHHEFQKKINHTGKIVRELQDLSMSMRMIPLKATFQKMTRLVRDLSRKVGKDVRLITDGEETEIDRNLVDVINDPLVHMIRNAVDHGVEDPETRQQAGKTSYGTVRLSAYHSAGSVVVEISDDGKGLNPDQILKKAQENGLVDQNESISERDIYNLIFEPGFSTAKKVTEVSGRGVGMDVVKKSIESLRGQVDISSELGKGTVFKMRIPLTLAIIDGMVVRTGSENYIIPTVSIVRSIKPEVDQVNTVLKTGEMLSHQGQLIPLFHLSDLFQLKGAEVDTTNTIVVVIEDENQQTGIIVDELIGRQQVVIKSLGETMQGIPGISGGAIMPNGRVGLIIDVGSLVRQVTNESRVN